MTELFVAAVGFIGLVYGGYPLWCGVRARFWPRPIARGPIRPKVSVLIAAWREETTIGPKIESLRAQSYPATLIEIVIACDGGEAATVEAAKRAAPEAKVLPLPARRGKPTALNAAYQAATGEVLVFTDARQKLSPQAIERLVEDLADPAVGLAGGELVLAGAEASGAYWRYEAWIRRCEGISGSTVGTSGALYAMRREDFEPLPEETILDDVLVPMRLRLRQKRVIFEPEAKAYDVAAGSGREFARKARTLSGNFQLIALVPDLLSPGKNPSWGDFVMHKLARLAVPFAMLIALPTAFFLPEPWGVICVSAQVAGYTLAVLRLLGVLRRSRIAGLCEALVVLNAAAVVGLLRFVRYGSRLPW